MSDTTGPDHTVVNWYADAAPLYRRAGWRQVIPLPHDAKFPPPEGVTGSNQKPVTDEQIAVWRRGWQKNLGIVMPDDVIAIDVDKTEGHARKADGAETLRRLEAELGPLPATWTSGHEPAGSPYLHRFYRVHTGLEFEGGAGEGIDILQHHHRYAVAWPSIHPNGTRYQWYKPDGSPYEGVPNVMWLTDLPMPWVNRLRKKPTPTVERRVNTLPMPHRGDDPRMCKAINTYLGKLLANPAAKGSRHDTMLQASWALIRFQEEGHRGALDALAQLKPYFIQATAPDRKGGEKEAEREFNSIVATALAKNTGIQGVSDPCDMSKLERLTPQEANDINTRGQAGNMPERRTAANKPESHANMPATVGNTTIPAATTTPQTNAGVSEESSEANNGMPDTWRFEDLTLLAEGEQLPAAPTVFEREDGQGLFYVGVVNDIHGEPGSGKSLVAQSACAQELALGRHVVYIDYEDNARNVVKRLRLMGVTPDRIVRLFHYVRPQARLGALTSQKGWQLTLRYAALARLCVIDGVTAAITGNGDLDSNNGDDINTWYDLMPRELARQGAGVVDIDHVVKTKENRGRFMAGSGQKLAQIDGVSYLVSVEKPIGRGLKGVIVLRSGKDRIGDIEEHCAPGWSEGHLREAARVTIDSTDPEHMRVHVGIPNRMPSADGKPAEPFRPTGLMERISRIIEDSAEEPTQTEVFDELKSDGSSARKDLMRRALKTLVDEEYLSSRVGERNRIYYRSLRPYRQQDDPESDSYQDRLTWEEANTINGTHNDDDTEFWARPVRPS